MKHDKYKKAQPKAETKSDPPWETPIETMGVRFFNTFCLSINVPLIVIFDTWYLIIELLFWINLRVFIIKTFLYNFDVLFSFFFYTFSMQSVCQ